MEYGNTKITQNALKKKRRSLSVENVEVGHYEIGRVWKHQNNPECTIKKEVKSVENVEHYETGGVWKHQNNPECTKKKEEVRVLKMLKLDTMTIPKKEKCVDRKKVKVTLE